MNIADYVIIIIWDEIGRKWDEICFNVKKWDEICQNSTWDEICHSLLYVVIALFMTSLTIIHVGYIQTVECFHVFSSFDWKPVWYKTGFDSIMLAMLLLCFCVCAFSQKQPKCYEQWVSPTPCLTPCWSQGPVAALWSHPPFHLLSQRGSPFDSPGGSSINPPTNP